MPNPAVRIDDLAFGRDIVLSPTNMVIYRKDEVSSTVKPNWVELNRGVRQPCVVESADHVLFTGDIVDFKDGFLRVLLHD